MSTEPDEYRAPMNPEPTNAGQPTPPEVPFDPPWELLPYIAGAGAGVLLRYLFGGSPGEAYSPMMLTFIVMAPVLVGVVTVFVAELRKQRGHRYYFWAPALANVLYVAASVGLQLEGWICAILFLPIAVLGGGLAGLVMGAICQTTRASRATLQAVVLLPLVFGAVESHLPLPQREGMQERRVVIDAPPAEVWRHLMTADDIRPVEVDDGWMYRIGVPLPLAGITRETPHGLVRDVAMGKGIRFRQVATRWEPDRFVDWRYRFGPASVPAGALDDHVRIGGPYFDLLGTTYALAPRGDATELTIRMHYRVSTQFNWYAGPIADLLIGNFSEVILAFYQRRSEAAA